MEKKTKMKTKQDMTKGNRGERREEQWTLIGKLEENIVNLHACVYFLHGELDRALLHLKVK